MFFVSRLLASCRSYGSGESGGAPVVINLNNSRWRCNLYPTKVTAKVISGLEDKRQSGGQPVVPVLRRRVGESIAIGQRHQKLR